MPCSRVSCTGCAAGKRDAVELPLDGTLLRGGEIDLAVLFVHAGDALDFPIAVGELSELLARQIVEIEMAESGALAGPQKALPVGEEMQVVADIDPVFVLFGEHGLGFSGGGVGEEQIQMILRAIQALDGHAAGIPQPGDARQQRALVGPVSIQRTSPPVDGDHADARHGIRASRRRGSAPR